MTIMNNVKLISLSEKLIKEYNEKNIYYCDIVITEVIKLRSGYRKEVNKKLKEQIFSEFRFNESYNYFENQIKNKLNIKLDKNIKIKEIILNDFLGKITINN